MKKCMIILIAILFATHIYAEEKLNSNRHNIGFTAGVTSDFGFAYRYWVQNSFGLEVFCFPYFNYDSDYYDNDYDEDTYLSFGGSLLKSILRSNYNNVFVYGRSSYFVNNRNYKYYYSDEIHSSGEDVFALGVGLGTELTFSVVNLSFKLGYQLSTESNWGDYYYNYDNEDSNSSITTSIDFAASLFYSFGDF